MIEPYLWRYHKGIQVVLKVAIDGRSFAMKVDKNSDAFGEVRLCLRQAKLLRVFCLDSCDDVW